MKTPLRFFSTIVVIAVLLCCTAGGAQSGAPRQLYLPLVNASAGPLPPILSEATKVLSDETLGGLTYVTPDQGTFYFDSTAPGINELQPGNVIAGGISDATPQGFLRRVTAVNEVYGQVVVDTVPATLEDALEQGELHLRRRLFPQNAQAVSLAEGLTLLPRSYTAAAGSFYLEFQNFLVFDADGDLDTKADQVTANGSLELAPTLDIDLRMSGFTVNEFKVEVGAEEKVDLKLSVKLEREFAKQQVPLGLPYVLPTMVATIGPLPVTVTPVISFYLGLDGQVHAGVTAGVSQQAKVSAGARYANHQWAPVSTLSNSFEFQPPTLSFGLNLKGYAGARLTAYLYGTLGAYTEVIAYLKLEADTAATPWWSLYGGLEVPVGVKVEVLGNSLDEYDKTVVGFKLLLAQAEGDNHPPYRPSNPAPANDAADQPLNLSLYWTGGDPDGDSLTYNVYLEAGDPQPDQLVSSGSAAHFTPQGLLGSTDYYWQVVAVDEHSLAVPGPVWHFRTEYIAPPTVDVKVNGGDDPLWFTTAENYTVSWSSSGADSCFGSGAASGWQGTAGSILEGPKPHGEYNYSITCVNAGGTATDSGLVYFIPASSGYHITAGTLHTCASTSSGAKCWGNNYMGDLGDGTEISALSPVSVVGYTHGAADISAGHYFSCALTPLNRAQCWGVNWNGQLGDGTDASNRTTPVNVVGLDNGVKSIHAGTGFACALTQAGAVKCWGYNLSGQLGNNSIINSNIPVDVIGLSSGVVALDTGFRHACAVLDTGAVKCWGDNELGQLGDGTTTDRWVPTQVQGLTSGVVGISAGLYHTCAVLADGGMKCWGMNTEGELGDNTTTNRLTPVDVLNLGGQAESVSAGDYHTCAVLTGGAVTCWGRNDQGQLGRGSHDTSAHPAPLVVPGMTSGWLEVGCGSYHTCAVSSGGAKCWGDGADGQLGDGGGVDRYSPVDVVNFP